MSELFTIDNIMTIVGLFTGGGLGVFFTMKWQKNMLNIFLLVLKPSG